MVEQVLYSHTFYIPSNRSNRRSNSGDLVVAEECSNTSAVLVVVGVEALVHKVSGLVSSEIL